MLCHCDFHQHNTHAEAEKPVSPPPLSYGAAEALHLGVVTALWHHDPLAALQAVDAYAYATIATEDSRLLVHAIEAHRVAAFVAVDHRLLADAVQANTLHTLVTAVAEEAGERASQNPSHTFPLPHAHTVGRQCSRDTPSRCSRHRR